MIGIPPCSIYSDRVKKNGKKDLQDQVGSLRYNFRLQQWKNSCLGRHQKSRLSE